MNSNPLPAARLAISLVLAFGGASIFAQETVPPSGVWAEYVETNFPFFSSVLDATHLGLGWPTNNLTPRGLILNLGHDCWACFDVDFLRVSALWSGKPVSAVSMSQISYHSAGVKAIEGEIRLPRMLGFPWLANGIYPGWQTGEHYSLADPRPPGPDPKEVGRGPLPTSLGTFKSLHLVRDGVSLEYELAGVAVREKIEAKLESGRPVIQRSFRLARVPQPLWLLLGGAPVEAGSSLQVALQSTGSLEKPGPVLSSEPGNLNVVLVPPAEHPVEFSVAFGMGPRIAAWKPSDDRPPPLRWPEIVHTRAQLSTQKGPYVVDDIPIPAQNPWLRNVRLADIAFFRDGRAAAVTFDGDVWTITGLNGHLTDVQWRRFASGFHEPLSLCVRDDELFVFDRNGIWRLRDTRGRGEADVHELFSNAFGQTAETREYATGIRPAPDGSFVISKGGIAMTAIGKHNGSVMRVSADGRTSRVLGWGLREPFIGVNPQTGLVTASDQQGNYVPSTPLDIIRDDQYYGFLSVLEPKERYPAPIADPLTWIPYPVNPSGAGQVWLDGAQMGPLNGALVHLGYYRPEAFVVLLNNRSSRPQAAVASLTRDFQFAPLHGAVNPADGQLYVTGFQIFGTTAPRLSGLARVRWTGAPSTLPNAVIPMEQGILLRFELPLDPATASDSANFSAERWNYRRTFNYGSPHFKPDGSKGQETMTPSSTYLSKDGKSVFIGLRDMKPVMQMRIGWALTSPSGVRLQQNAYFTPYELARFDPEAEGFAPLTVDLSPRTRASAPEMPASAEEGARQAELLGCTACHSTDGSLLGKVGPTWKGLFGSEVILADGARTKADEAYLHESIQEPSAKIVQGYDKSDVAMPSYAGLVSESQIASLILYIQSLSQTQ